MLLFCILETVHVVEYYGHRYSIQVRAWLLAPPQYLSQGAGNRTTDDLEEKIQQLQLLR